MKKRNVISCFILCLVLITSTSSLVFADSEPVSVADMNKVTIEMENGEKIIADKESFLLSDGAEDISENKARVFYRNSVYVKSNMTTPMFRYADKDGSYSNSIFNITEKYSTNNSFVWMIVPLETKNNTLSKLENSGRIFDGKWKVEVSTYIDAKDPLSITYRDNGVEKKQTVYGNTATITYYVDGLSNNSILSGVLNYYDGGVYTSMFTAGVQFEEE